MRRILLLVVAIAAFGCGDQQVAPPDQGSLTASQKVNQSLPEPDFTHTSKLALRRLSGQQVQVGATLEGALNVFAKPPQNSYEKRDRPPSIPETFDVFGWQGPKEGFGMIVFKGQVAAAVYELDHSNEDRLTEILKLERDALGPASVFLPGKYVRYWFWTSSEADAHQTLMVCATEAQPHSLTITQALGVDPVMDALGMTEKFARSDQRHAETRIDKQRTANKPNSANSSNR